MTPEIAIVDSNTLSCLGLQKLAGGNHPDSHHPLFSVPLATDG